MAFQSFLSIRGDLTIRCPPCLFAALSEKFSMGSRSFFAALSQKCACGRRLYPQPDEYDYCLFCESYAKTEASLKVLARDTFFNAHPDLRERILQMSSVDALAEFNRAILQYILRSPGSPCRAFTYFYNGLAGNISDTEDILDRIICFV